MDKMRAEFEAWLPLPDGVKWHEKHAAYYAAKGDVILTASAYHSQWKAWQAARQPERGEAVDLYLRTRVADLLHLLQHAEIRTPSPGDHREAVKAIADIQSYVTAHPPAADARVAELEARLAELRDYHAGHVSGAQTSYDEFTARIAALEAQLADMTAARDALLPVVDERNELESQLTDSREREGRMRELNDDLRWILGRPNFACGGFSRHLRQIGYQIAEHAEDEQAAVIHWMLMLYLEYGTDWRAHTDAALAAEKGKK